MSNQSSLYRTAWVANLAFFAAYYALLIPMPRYLVQIGLPDWQVGAILGAFGVASIIGRPLAGMLTGAWGSRAVMLLGGALVLVGATGVDLTDNPWLLFILRLAQAGGYVAFTTAGTALIANLAPPDRQGGALALFGAAANVAMTFTPLVINSVIPLLGLNGIFWLCGGLAAGSTALSLVLPGERGVKGPGWRERLAIPRQLFRPIIVAVMCGVGFGTFLQFLPLLTERRGLEPVGLAYAVYGASIIITRLVTGRWQNRANRNGLLAGSFAGLTVALVGLAFCNWEPWLLANMILMAAAMGVLHPGLMATHVELVPPHERWRGVVGFYLGYDAGIGLGSWLLSPVLEWAGLTGMYLAAGLLALVGVGLALKLPTREKSS